MKMYYPLMFLLILLTAKIVEGQSGEGDRRLKFCTEYLSSKGLYKKLSVGLGKELQVDVEIKPSYRNDENYITIAREFRERYCHIKEMRITYFASKKQWQILDPFELESTPLAIYYYGEKKDEIGLDVYKVVNNKVETRKVDLSQYKVLSK